MSVFRFSPRPDPERGLEQLRQMLDAEPLSLNEVMTEPVTVVMAPGKFVLASGSPDAETIDRIAAVAIALRGPGSITWDVGVQALRYLIDELEEEVSR